MNPDPFWYKAYLLAGVLFNIGTYVALVWRHKKRDTLKEGQDAWKFQAMWEDFKERKHIKARNGDSH